MNIINNKIVSTAELAKITTTDESHGITYNDIKQKFSKEDLQEYNVLCGKFVTLLGNKNNKERWDMIFDPVIGTDFISILNKIEELRKRYNLPGKFHKVWRAAPSDNDNFEYDEIWW